MPRRSFLTVVLLVLCAFSLAASSVADAVPRFQGLPIREFFDVSYKEWLLRDPEKITVLGLAGDLGIRNDELTDVSTAFAEETATLLEEILVTLRTYDRAILSRDDQLSYDVYEWFLQDELAKLEYRMHDYLISSFSVYSEDWLLMDLLGSNHPMNNVDDVEDYISRLSKVEWKMKQIAAEMQARQEVGIVPPRFMVTRSIEQIRGWLGIWFGSPASASEISPYGVEIYQTSRSRFRDCDWMTDEELDAYTGLMVDAVKTSYVPGLFALLQIMEALLPDAPAEGGAANLPNGAEYLDYAIRHHTTTDLTAEEMMVLGEAEVERILGEMRGIFESMGYPHDAPIRDLWNRAYADAVVPAGFDWMEEYQQIYSSTEAAIELAFDLRPSAGVEIRQAPVGTMVNYYIEPAHDGSRPGIFYAQPSSRPSDVYGMPVVFHHEAVPGHHFQLAMMQELDLPLFRRIEMPTSSGEGWAVYAEGLLYDLGLYDGNPLGNLERLNLELMRAARIPVEMGIHNLGWTHREGAAYFADVMGYPVDAMVNLMPRYVGYPGQGSSYTVGLLKVRELRQRAMDTLGEAFDLRDFHNVLLGDGALPLEIHERLVDDWLQGACK